MTTWPFDAYPQDGLVELGPHVTGFYSEGFPLANSAVVRGADATLVFDANTLRFARRLHSITVAEGPPLRELVVSHAHDDHAVGAGYFAPPARVLAHRATRDRMARWAAEPQGRLIEMYADADYYEGSAADARELRVVVPGTVVQERSSVDLGGGVRVHLTPLAEVAHTKGDLWAYVEPDDVDAHFDRVDAALSKLVRDIDEQMDARWHLNRQNVEELYALQNLTFRSYALLYKYREGDAASLAALRANDPALQTAMGKDQKVGEKELEAVEAQIKARLKNLNQIREQIMPQVERYLAEARERDELYNQHKDTGKKLRLSLMLWARSHRNLAAGIAVPPEIDLYGRNAGIHQEVLARTAAIASGSGSHGFPQR